MNKMTLPSRHRNRTLAVCYLSVCRLSTILNLYEWAGKKHFVSLKLECRSGVRTLDLWLSKQAALTTAPGPQPHKRNTVTTFSGLYQQCWPLVSWRIWCLFGRNKPLSKPTQGIQDINPWSAKLNNSNFTHLKLCLATATHNFKWMKMTPICLIWYQAFAKIEPQFCEQCFNSAWLICIWTIFTCKKLWITVASCSFLRVKTTTPNKLSLTSAPLFCIDIAGKAIIKTVYLSFFAYHCIHAYIMLVGFVWHWVLCSSFHPFFVIDIEHNISFKYI